MIIVNIKGGLGNQMFQYACGRALSLKNGAELKFDTWVMESNIGTKRSFSLSNFGINGDLANQNEVNRLKYGGVLRKTLRIILRYPKTYLEERHFGFKPKVLENKGDLYLDGYWQSYKYFKGYESIIRKDLTLAGKGSNSFTNFNKEIINFEETVSVHVRRSDYLNQVNKKIWYQCNKDYYKRAMQLVENELKKPVKYFVFSDDINWVKNNLNLKDVIYIDQSRERTDAEDLVLMSLCKHNIIANSTFSWWAAWLNSNKNKIVITPKNWYRDKRDNKLVKQDLILSGWRQI